MRLLASTNVVDTVSHMNESEEHIILQVWIEKHSLIENLS